MEMIQHNYVNVRGIKLHVAEIGTGPAVVFLHGFPEIWYSWRHQMLAAADAGFRAMAPDFRGFGLSEVPSEPEKTTFKDLVDDLLELFDSFELPKVFLVGKDFGARVVYHFALLHQDRVSGIVTMGLPFMPTGPTVSMDPLPEGFYFMRFRESGRAERDFGRFDVKTVVRKIYILFTESELQVAKEDQEIMDLVDPSAELPPWFTEEDLANYAKLYENSGFQTAMQIPYRAWLEFDGVAPGHRSAGLRRCERPVRMWLAARVRLRVGVFLDEIFPGACLELRVPLASLAGCQLMHIPRFTRYVMAQGRVGVARLACSGLTRFENSTELLIRK